MSIYIQHAHIHLLTIWRRYPGFYALMNSFKAIGLLQTDVTIAPRAWSDLTRCALEALLREPVPAQFADFVPRKAATDELWDALAWLGLAPSPSPPLPLPLPRPLPFTP